MIFNQVVDSGLNETSCFFADGDGGEVAHGHYFEEVGSTNAYFSSDSVSSSKFVKVFDGGDFTYDSSRRKVLSVDCTLFGDMYQYLFGTCCCIFFVSAFCLSFSKPWNGVFLSRVRAMLSPRFCLIVAARDRSEESIPGLSQKGC